MSPDTWLLMEYARALRKTLPPSARLQFGGDAKGNGVVVAFRDVSVPHAGAMNIRDFDRLWRIVLLKQSDRLLPIVLEQTDLVAVGMELSASMLPSGFDVLEGLYEGD